MTQKTLDQITEFLHDSLTKQLHLSTRMKTGLQNMRINNMLELYANFPKKIIHRHRILTLQEQYNQKYVIIFGTVLKISKRQGKSRSYIVKIMTANRQILHIYYQYFYYGQLQNIYQPDTKLYIAGKLQKYRNQWIMFHPEYVKHDIHAIPSHEILYSYNKYLSRLQYQAMIDNALDKLPDPPEWLPLDFIKAQKWLSWHESILTMHRKKNLDSIDSITRAQTRLIFDELLSQQLTMGQLISNRQSIKTVQQKHNGKLLKQFLQQIPFQFTDSQQQALAEIIKDLKKNTPMIRLLQGDVGSGKTIVAMAAMVHTAENKQQAVLLAPTIALAKQHYKTCKKMLDKLNLSIVYLSSRLSSATQKDIREKIRNKKTHIIIGTHALLTQKTIFTDLGLFVIDEQHRFGVEQRNVISKYFAANVLMMTATPIPRTLLLAKYSDMQVSNLDNHVKQQNTITTSIISSLQITKLVQSLDNIMQQDNQVYWVCPTIDQEHIKHLTVKQRSAYLEKKLPQYRIVTLHGNMTTEEQGQAMENFRQGKANLMVSTTMIEVGIHIPQASVIIIENPEQFGLLQLHQMRGRVGRGTRPGYCVLLYNADTSLSTQNIHRLHFFKTHHRGLEIAEFDFMLRGAGDVFKSNRQSGKSDFLFVTNYTLIKQLLPHANTLAKKILKQNQNKTKTKATQTQNQLYQFLQEIFTNTVPQKQPLSDLYY